MQRHQLQKLSREELIREAEGAGVPRPRVLTQAELIDEILKRTATSDRERARTRGWLGRARDLLATVVEKGLHLPDAAAAIRSGPKGWPPPPPPLATVTLAEIYAAQGHLERAVAVLDEVIAREPDHQEARELRDRFRTQLARGAKAAPEPPKEDAPEEPGDEEGSVAERETEPAPVPVSKPIAERETEPAPEPRARTVADRDAAEREAAEREAARRAAPSTEEAAPARDVTPPTPAASEPASAGAAAEPAGAGAGAAPGAEAPAAALPERYDVDEVVALAVDPSTFYVYWEVRALTFAHVNARSPGGSLALRVVAITPGWDGPIVETRDIHIDALFGDRFIHHVRPRADVRVSVGWLEDGRFDPIAVGAEVSAPRAFVAAGAPAGAGAPLDLSEGLHGARSGAARAAEHVTRSYERAAERLAAGLVPRELWGATMEPAPAVGPGGEIAGWIWVPGGAGGGPIHVSFGPLADARGGAGRSAAAPRWGGASEAAPRWGGASEAAPRWGASSEASLR